MNWNKIKEKYPKALEKFMRWDFGDNKTDFEEWFDTAWWLINKRNIRDLYDFFDEQGIYIELWYLQQKEFMFAWHITFINEKWEEIGIDRYQNKLSYLMNRTDKNHKGMFKTRTEAEEKVFGKAFEILETKLNKGE